MYLIMLNGLGLFILMFISSLVVLESFTYSKLKKGTKELQEDYFNLLENISEKEEVSKKIDEVISKKQEDYYNLVDTIKDKYEKAENEYKETYLSTLEEYAKDFCNKKKLQEKDIEKLREELKTLKTSYQARIEIAKREQEDKDKRNYYRWQLSDAAVEDIKRMQTVKASFSSPEIIDKVLWKTYYEKATNDLITRVVGNSNPCGIYKITNLLNEKVYIGQSIRLKDRIKEHAKSGTGAATAADNKLYTSIKQDGLWNFTWEVIEECSREKLNEREAFWIDFYDASSYGLNSNRGVGV